MQQYSVEIAPNILESVLGVVKFLLARKFAGYLISGLAIAGLTFGLLELFMRPGLRFEYGKKGMGKDAGKRYKASILCVVLTLLPMIAVIVPIFTARYRNPSAFTTTLKNIAISFGIAMLLCWITSWNLKRYLTKEEIKGKKFLLLEAVHVFLQTTGEYIAEWLSRLVMGIINLGIKIIHRPFIMEYAIVAIVLNLVFSFVVMIIMGQSNEAGAANIMGSLIGGAIHALVRRNHIKALKTKYLKEGTNAHRKRR